MKKSEKLKGKEMVVQRKKQYKTYGIVAGTVIIIAAIVFFVLFNPFVIKAGDTATVYYTGTLDDGTVFDSNVGGTPVVFTLGEGKLIAGFEEGVIGMGVNETKIVHIPVDKAYGAYNEALVHVMNRSVFPANIPPVVGQQYRFTRPSDGAVTVIKVVNVTPSTVTVDENHALAGKNLTYSIQLVSFTRK
jgi:peptidylprolyl isomerase